MSRALPIAVGLALMVGGASAARTGEQAAQPRTLAKVHGSVDALAQDGRRIAWIKTHAHCGRQLQVLTLPGRRPVYVGSRRGRSCTEVGGTIGAIALASDGRVLWQGLAGFGNTELRIDLATAAPRAPRTRLVADMGLEYEHSPDEYFQRENALPMAAHGDAVLFYGRCDTGGCTPRQIGRPAIYRLAGRGLKRLARVTSPVELAVSGLAVSGHRFAVVTNSPRCCNFTPTWSRDGTRLAWIYHGDLWTIYADGTRDQQLAGGASSPSWSADDTRLVFEHTEAHEQHGVYRIDATGGGLKRLASGTSPAWSPDGTRIAFVRGKDVYAIDPDGTGETKLTTTQRPTAGPLAWSPDSSRIAVSRGGDIYSLGADRTGETRLTTSPHAEDQPAWSPNGAKIAYVDESSASPGINVVDADGSGATRLTSPTYPIDGSPTWSPDSSRIAFIRDVDLWIVNADGSGVRGLPGEEYASPQWAPDGSSIAVGDNTRDQLPYHPGIRLVSPADGRARKIAPVPHSSAAIRDARTGRLIKRFSVDGYVRTVALGAGYVAAAVDHDPGLRVELYNLDGSFRSAATVPSSIRNVSAAGQNVVFATGRVIQRLDARTGVVSALATARRKPVGLTIEGRRVVWAENIHGVAQIRTVTAP